MSVIQLDVKKFESGLGFGDLAIITGAPFASPVTRTSGILTGTPLTLGNADGYDLSNATALRVYYDVVIGAATYLDLLFRPVAANLERSGGKEMVPVPPAPFARTAFDPKVVTLPDSAGPFKVAPAAIRFEATGRGSFTIPRNSALIHISADSDADDSAIALAVQSILEPGGE